MIMSCNGRNVENIKDQCKDIRTERERFDFYSKCEGFTNISHAELVKVTEKSYCFDFGKAGIGRLWVAKSISVFIMLGVDGYQWFIPTWVLVNFRKRREVESGQ